MIKISTENFTEQSHPPCIIHFEHDGKDKEYVDEIYLEEDMSKIIDYIKKTVIDPNVDHSKSCITGKCRINPNIKHIFILKYSSPEVLGQIKEKL